MFSTTDAMLFHQNTCKAENNAIEMSQAFHDTTRFKHFTDLNLFKYAFNVIQDWEMDALFFFFSMVLINFLLAVEVEGDESSWLRTAN